MSEAGIDYQTYFCLEDFGDNEAGAIRNLGIFSFDLARRENKEYAKANYNVWRMLGLSGQDSFTAKFSDEFVGVISTRSPDYLALLIYNYIDPQAAMNYISHNIVYLNSVEQKAILGIVKSDRMKKILAGQLSLATLRLSVKTKGILSRAIELNNLANKFSTTNRKIKISLKGIKDTYILSQYVMDNSCSRNCEFKPSSEKDVDFNQGYADTIELSPFSVQLLVFKKKPAEIKPVAALTTTSQAETKSSEAKPEEKSSEAKAPEVKPGDKPTEIKPAAALTTTSQAETKSVEAKPEEKTAVKGINNAEAK